MVNELLIPHLLDLLDHEDPVDLLVYPFVTPI